MVVRFYSSTAQVSALTASINNAVTTMVLTTVSGWPTSTPFTAVIDPDTPSAEIVNVSATAGTTYTIQRAIDGTSAAAHNTGAVVRHMATARDFADSRAHENATANVHGIGGASLVGTTTAQTLTNKVINGATFDNINTGAWVPYAPVWSTFNNPQPALGVGGILNGRYNKVGRMVTVKIYIFGGLSGSYGNGAWRFSLPFPAVSTQPIGSGGNVAWSGEGSLNGLGVADFGTMIFENDLTRVSGWGTSYGGTVTLSALDATFFNIGFNSATLTITYETAS